MTNSGPQHGEGKGGWLASNDRLPLLFLFGLISSVFLPPLFLGTSIIEKPYMRDIAMGWLPYLTGIARDYQSGLMPVWDSQNLLGAPLVPHTYLGIFYPPMTLWFFLCSYPVALLISDYLHLLFAGVGIYLLIRRLGMSPLAATAAAVAYSLSGALFAFLNHPTRMNTQSWVPWVFISLILISKRPRLSNLLLLILTAGAAGLAGEVESFAYLMISASLFVALVLGRGNPRRIGNPAVMILGLVVVALMLQLFFVPGQELVKHSIRAPGYPLEISFGDILTGYYYLALPLLIAPFDFMLKITPYESGNHGLPGLYLGLVAVVGAIMAFLHRGDERVRPLLWWMGSLTVVAVIFFTPGLERITYHIPVIKSMMNRVKWFENFEFGLLLLSAAGLDRLEADVRAGGVRRPAGIAFILLGVFTLASAPFCVSAWSRWMPALAMAATGAMLFTGRLKGPRLAILVVVVLITDVYLLAQTSLPRTDWRLFDVPDSLTRPIASDPGHPRFLAIEGLFNADQIPDPTGITQAATGADSLSTNMRVPLGKSFLLLHDAFPGVLTGATAIYNVTEIHNPNFLELPTLRLMNLTGVKYVISRRFSLRFASPYYLLRPSSLPVSPELVGKAENLAGSTLGSYTLKMTSPSAITFWTPIYAGTRFRSKVSAPAVAAGQGGSFLQLLEMQKGSPRRLAWCRFFPGEGLTSEVDAGLEPSPNGAIALRLSAVPAVAPGGGFALPDPRIERPDTPLREDPVGSGLYINRDALPRAWLAIRAKVVTDEEARKLLIKDERFNPRDTVLLAEADPLGPLPPIRSARPAAVEIFDYRTSRVAVRVRKSGPRYLVLSDAYYPGWVATVNGQERRIMRANLGLRAVLLDQPDSEVVFTFRPYSFRVTWWLLLTTITVAAALGVWRLKKLPAGST